MGLKPIFDMNQANFAGILDTTVVKNNLFVSEIIQKSFIEVNEGGTVAAAATSIYTNFSVTQTLFILFQELQLS